MTFYSDLASDTDALIREFGQAVTLTARAEGAYDPETGSVTVTETTQTGQGVVFDFGLHQSGSSFTAGSMILAGDKQLLLSAIGIAAPTVADTVVVSGDTWTIVSIKSTAPAGEVVLYECQLRK